MKKSVLFLAAAMLMLAGCNNAEKAEPKSECEATASLAAIAEIPYSKTTVNPKEGKRVLVVCGSPRHGGNDDLLCDEFVKGATEVGGVVEKVFLADYELEFLSEEAANQPKSISHDTPTGQLVDKFLNADVVCLASPTYYMNVSDRMKAFMDATYIGYGDSRMSGKEYYYITACADNEANTAEWCFNGFRGFVYCLPNSTERGCVAAIGMGRAGAVQGTPYMQQAYELGKTINKK